MTDYNDGKWHGWNGGECPVHPETIVEYVTINGHNDNRAACGLVFDRDNLSAIIAFRVIKEHREPREFWIRAGVDYPRAYDAEPDDASRYIHVREVMDE